MQRGNNIECTLFGETLQTDAETLNPHQLLRNTHGHSRTKDQRNLSLVSPTLKAARIGREEVGWLIGELGELILLSRPAAADTRTLILVIYMRRLITLNGMKNPSDFSTPSCNLTP